MLVHHFLEQSAAEWPEKVALVCGGQRLTYLEINLMANRLANGLREQGIRQGDRVGIYLGNTVETVIGIFAVLKAGGVFVIINPTTKLEKLLVILNNCRATGLITSWSAATQPDIASALLTSRLKFVLCAGPSTEMASVPRKLTILDFDSIQRDNSAEQHSLVSTERDLACLIYTSGTTGEPKGVMCGHNNIVFAATAIVQYLRNTHQDIVMNVLPLSFTYGLYQLLTMCQVGGTLILEESLAYPGAVLNQMQAEGVTGFPGVPTIFAMLLRLDFRAFDLSTLRYLTNAAAGLPTEHVLEIRRRLPRVAFYSMYGQTETARTLYLPPEWIDRKPESVGIPIPGTEVWIEDESGNRPEPGQIGELVVRGKHVMRGYWEATEATFERFRPGPLPREVRCYTGDLFRQDTDGFFYFVSRKDDIIKCKGQKVAPKEIEDVLHQVNGVIHAAVVGVPDPIFGQAIKAVLVVEDGVLSAKEVQAYCRAHLEDFMVPKYVEVRPVLPMTTSGKIKKRELV